MYIGNIVTEVDIKDSGLFFITKDISGINSELPTLIIGWDLTKRIMVDKKISILEKKISNTLYWTFTKRERRIDFESDFKQFVAKSILMINNTVEYKYLNLFDINYSQIKKLIETLDSTSISYIYISQNSFIYVYNNSKIFGIDLNTIDFIKIDRKKIYRLLYSNKNKVFFNDDFLSKDIKQNIPINNNKILPYLYKISNNGN